MSDRRRLKWGMTGREIAEKASELRARGLTWLHVESVLGVPQFYMKRVVYYYGSPQNAERCRGCQTRYYQKHKATLRVAPMQERAPAGSRGGAWLKALMTLQAEGLCYNAIAKRLGVNRNVVAGALYRARRNGVTL